MTASIALFSPLDRVTDSDGNPVSGAKINVYEAGTSTRKTVYSNSALTVALPNPVICNSAGQPTSDGNTTVVVYVDTSSYKLVVTTADDVTVPGMSYDNIRGADAATVDDDVAIPSTPVVARTSTYQILAADRGRLINANPTGGSFALTLPSAVTVGDGWRVGVRHSAASSNTVTIRSAGAQTIGAPGQAAAVSISLTGLGQTMWFVSDGAGWHVDSSTPPLLASTMPVVRIFDRLTAPPASPLPGARYIINGTPTGAWATLSFAQNDIAEADGNGSWFKYAPQDGWLAYVTDENVYTSFQDTAWTDLSNVTAPATTTRKAAQYSYTVAQNTSGPIATSGAWTTYPFGTEDYDTIGASISSSVITLPTGTFDVEAIVQVYGMWPVTLRLRNTTTGAIVYGVVSFSPGFSTTPTVLTGQNAVLSNRVTVSAATETFVLEYYATSVNGSSGRLGNPQNVSGISETYGTIKFIDAVAVQGPTGAQGEQGNTGAGYGGASVTSQTIGTGEKLFVLDQADYAYVVGSRVRIASAATPTSYMEGVVTAYSGYNMTVDVDSTAGAGELASWNVSLAGIVPNRLINDLEGDGYSIGGVTSAQDTITTSGNLTAAMSGKVLIVNSAGNVTLTMPNSLPVGWTATFVQINTGQAVFAAASGATIHNRQSDTRTHSQWAMAVLTVVANSGGSAAVAVLGGDTA